ncbi:MAG: hypothetical protein H7308_07565 [Chthonomonadaceae bacterium]|nr:hypothetical protein [Chthonomonadaceae bacterium]
MVSGDFNLPAKQPHALLGTDAKPLKGVASWVLKDKIQEENIQPTFSNKIDNVSSTNGICIGSPLLQGTRESGEGLGERSW